MEVVFEIRIIFYYFQHHIIDEVINHIFLWRISSHREKRFFTFFCYAIPMLLFEISGISSDIPIAVFSIFPLFHHWQLKQCKKFKFAIHKAKNP
jgi:hypothetical protein